MNSDRGLTLKPIIHGKSYYEDPGWKELKEWEFDRPVEIWINTFSGIHNGNNSFKIFIDSEPDVIQPQMKAKLLGWTKSRGPWGLMQALDDIKNGRRIHLKSLFVILCDFDLILTRSEIIYDNLSNANLFFNNDTWLGTDFVIPEKKFVVSFIVGEKNFAPGHRLRRDIWMEYPNIHIPTAFYRGPNTPLPIFEGTHEIGPPTGKRGGSKDILFTTPMFHISIENCKRRYYFTDKLLDCFLSKTVPIYWGCSNIDEYFDPNGIITFENENELLRILDDLNENDYVARKESIEYNYCIAKNYINVARNAARSIEEFLR